MQLVGNESVCVCAYCLCTCAYRVSNQMDCILKPMSLCSAATSPVLVACHDCHHTRHTPRDAYVMLSQTGQCFPTQPCVQCERPVFCYLATRALVLLACLRNVDSDSTVFSCAAMSPVLAACCPSTRFTCASPLRLLLRGAPTAVVELRLGSQTCQTSRGCHPSVVGTSTPFSRGKFRRSWELDLEGTFRQLFIGFTCAPTALLSL